MYEIMFDFQQDNGVDDDVLGIACMKWCLIFNKILVLMMMS